MKKDFTQKDLKEIEKTSGDHIGLIYLTGSWLTGVQDEDSDRDFYVFRIPTKRELLTLDTERGKQVKLSFGDVKFFYMSHLYSLLLKSNPTMAEMFFKHPVYVSDEAREVGKYIYTHRNAVPQINPQKFIKSSMGMMYNNMKRMNAHSYDPKSNGSFGKDYYNFDKAYRYAKALIDSTDFESQVFLTGNALQESKKKKQATTAEGLQDEIDELQSFLDEHFYTGEPDLFLNGVAKTLPIYRGEKVGNKFYKE